MQTQTHEVSDPIDVLMEEHRLIERVIGALEVWAARGATERSDLSRFVDFIRTFADAEHHAKEEDVLFQAMAEAGFPTEGGPIAVMLEEHALGRRFVAQLASPETQPAALVTAARGYASLLRQHIQKEDRILYPMARNILGPGMAEVARRCAALDEAATRRDELRRTAEELIRIYH